MNFLAPVREAITDASYRLTLPWLSFFTSVTNALNKPVPQDPVFNTNWGNFGGTSAHVTYYSDASQIIHIEGIAKRTGASGAGETIFTLPVNYRPSADTLFACYDGAGAIAQVGINTSGAVVMASGDASGYVALTGITFLSA